MKFAVPLLLLPLPAVLYGQGTTPPQPGQPAAAHGQQQPPANSLKDLSKTVSAPPFTVRDKFEYRVVQTFGARGFVGAAISAAIGQADNSPHEWGQGAQGYGERFGSGFAGNVSRQTFAFALESSFHEDPRYFPSEDKSKGYRLVNALKQVIICKTDTGRSELAYARLISQFGNGQFVNIWQPKSTGSAADGVRRAFIGLGGDAAYDLLQEFLPFTRPRSLRHRH